MTDTDDPVLAQQPASTPAAPLHERLLALKHVSQELAKPRDAQALFRAVFRATARVLDVQAFTVGLYDEVSQTVEVIGQVESGVELPGGNFPLGDGLTSQVIRSRQPRLIRYWSQDGPPVEVRYASNVPGLPESAITVPLLFDEHVLGVVSAYSYEPRAFNEDDLLVLEVIGGQAAIALANLSHSKHLDARLQSRISELEAILASMADALLIVDAEGRVVRLNHAARALLSLNHATIVLGQLLDREHWRAWPPGAQQVAQTLAPLIEALQRGEQPDETEVELAGPGRRVLSFSGTPLHDAYGAITGSVLLVRDLTGRREMEELKDEMLAIASHDLRVPITVIKAQAQLLRRTIVRGSATLPVIDEGLGSIVRQTDHLGKLLSLLLDLTRIDAGRLELQPKPMELRALVAGTIADIQATTTRHQLKMRAIRQVFDIWDERRLQEVLENLLTNAVKYSPEGGPIVVSVRATKTLASVRVSDTGVGLAPEEAPHVFERFYRGKGIRLLEGAGLGLYICQAIIAAHGGRIWAESAGPGSGTSFCFTLPRATNAGQSQGISPED
jgi:PAS domain S-box-containing protein